MGFKLVKQRFASSITAHWNPSTKIRKQRISFCSKICIVIPMIGRVLLRALKSENQPQKILPDLPRSFCTMLQKCSDVQVIMDHNRSAATRELVVTCTVHIVDAQGSRIKSGWMNLFSGQFICIVVSPLIFLVLP